MGCLTYGVMLNAYILSKVASSLSSQNASGYRSRSHDAKPGMPMMINYAIFV